MTDSQRVKIDETEVDEIGNVTIVHFCEQHIGNLSEIEELGQELYELIEDRLRRKLVLDFSGVQYFSSAAIGKLISLNGRVKARSGMMKLCSLRPEVLEVFRICRLDQVFDIREDETDAMLSFEERR